MGSMGPMLYIVFVNAHQLKTIYKEASVTRFGFLRKILETISYKSSPIIDQ